MIRYGKTFCQLLVPVLLALALLHPLAHAEDSLKPERVPHQAPSRPSHASLIPAQLKTESAVNPVGIDVQGPRLSWILAARIATERGLAQTAYRVLVASSAESLKHGQGDAWDSHKVPSSETFNVAYDGKPLLSSRTYYWKVAVWDQAGQLSSWSQPAKWTTGLMHPDDWTARWIAAISDGAPPVRAREKIDDLQDYPPPLPIFRRDFRIDKTVKQAIVHVSGLGQYELHINGLQVTDSVLNPGWTNYRKTILYNSWDVTHLLKRGGNALGLLLGNGMYNVEGTKGRYTKFIGSFGQLKLLLQLHVDFDDGSTATIVSDGSWKTAPGPITFSSTYGGEDYDARREELGWDAPGFNDSAWAQAIEVSSPGGQLAAQMGPPIKAMQVYNPRTIRQPKLGVLVYDLGQNFSGWPEISVRGPRGATVKLTAGELLDKNGFVSQHSANAGPDAENLFSFTLKGRGTETWSPRFSYYGFRYVQVDGASRAASSTKPVIVSLRGKSIHDAATETGEFSTSNQLFMRIHRLIDMAIESNMVSVLTDCPHREKLGWLEQTYLAGPSILYNYDLSELYTKMARDMRDSQLSDGLVPAIAPEYVAFVDRNGVSNAFRDSPEWGSAMILSPWTAYEYFGDRRLLADNYDAMVRYIAFLRSKKQNNLLTYGLGDWYDIGPKPPGESQLTQKGITATTVFYQDLTVLAKIAVLVGKEADAKSFAAEAATVRESINSHFLNAGTGQYDKGSQTSNAIPLALGLVPHDLDQQVMDHLIDDIRQHQNHVTAGDIGFHYVVRALTDHGRSDVLNDMLLRTDSPSYGYQLEQGATSLTEAWDTNPASSQNHFMLGHAEEWFYRGLAGLDFNLGRPKPRQIVICPSLASGTRDASARYNSVLGMIASSWSRTAGRVTMSVEIPPGASATIYIPTGDMDSIRESGRPLQDVGEIHFVRARDATECTVSSGHYRFTFPE